MMLGRMLAFDLRASGPGALPEAYNFQANLLQKRPGLVGPEDLRSLRRLAWDMSERPGSDVETRLEYRDAADEALSLMTARFPDRPETLLERRARAHAAIDEGDYQRAAAELAGALRSPGLTPELRSGLLREADRLRYQGGVTLPPTGPTPDPAARPGPDPAFAPPPPEPAAPAAGAPVPG